MTSPPLAHPPETLEGWYVLHQIFRSSKKKAAIDISKSIAQRVAALDSGAGWSCCARLIGSASDFMVVHFRESLDAIGEAQDALSEKVGDELALSYSFLSVTEAGLYHLTAELAREAVERGGSVGDAEYTKAVADRAKAERE